MKNNTIKQEYFVKTNDRIIDSFIKFTIYNPYFVIFISYLITVLSLSIFIFIFGNLWCFLGFILLLVLLIILNLSDFSDKLLNKKMYHIINNHKICTYYVYLYEYTEKLNNINTINNKSNIYNKIK